MTGHYAAALKKLAPRLSLASSDVQLKPCPLCGIREVHLIRVSDFFGEGDAFYVSCTTCEPRQFPGNRDDSVRDWNQRQIIDLWEVLNASR